MKLDYEVVIDRPIHQVWQYANDPDHLHLWLNDFLRREPIAGDGHTMNVGDTATTTYRQGKGEFTMLEEVTKSDPPNHLTLSMTSKMFDMVIINNYESVGPNQTKLFAGAEFVRLGLMMKVIFAFSSKKKMLADHVRQIDKLKALIEAS